MRPCCSPLPGPGRFPATSFSSPIGTGRPDANLATARTNFVSALAQCEAAMEIFREQDAGHFVMEDAPGEVAEVLADFFSGDGTSS